MNNIAGFALLAGLGLVVAGPAIAQQAAPLAGNAEAGEKRFMAIGCQQCHGAVAQGASTGPRLAPEPVPFEIFLHQLRRPASDMPPYEPAILSDRQAADIYAFLQTIPKPPDPESIALLRGS